MRRGWTPQRFWRAGPFEGVPPQRGRPKQYCLQLDIAVWYKNQIEHSIWDESLLFCICTCSLEYSSLSTLAGLSYHICGKLKVAFKASPSSQHQHCTDEAQKAETVLSAVIYIYVERERGEREREPEERALLQPKKGTLVTIDVIAFCYPIRI